MGQGVQHHRIYTIVHLEGLAPAEMAGSSALGERSVHSGYGQL